MRERVAVRERESERARERVAVRERTAGEWLAPRTRTAPARRRRGPSTNCACDTAGLYLRDDGVVTVRRALGARRVRVDA